MGTAAFEPVVLVTGAGRGIGYAIAKTLARAGYAIALHYWDEPESAAALVAELRQQGSSAWLLTGDLTKEGVPARVVGEAISAAGRIDGVVNNAGRTISKPFLEMDAESIDFLYRLNFLAPFLISQAAARWMVGHRVPGAIVQITSVHYERVTDQDSMYGASRAATARAMQSMAYELAPYGIRVNAVAPGRILTPRLKAADRPERLQAVDAAIPVRRSGTPEDVADVVRWLLSPQSGYVTGVTVRVDGGLNLSMPPALIDGRLQFI